MAHAGGDRRSYSAGKWGRNRVRIFRDPRTGMIQIEWRVDGRRVSRSLGHRNWKRAEEQADQFADGKLRLTPRKKAQTNATPRPLTLGALFHIYAEEVTPTKASLTQKLDMAAMRMFLEYFGKNRDPSALSQRDWDRFIRDRRSGTAGHSGKPVANQTIARDLTFLLAVLNWAAKWRDEAGRLLLETNPLKGLKTPTEKNPRRVVLKESEYQALLEVAPQVGWRFHVALVLAHETGHRIGAIRHLRWSDIDFEEGIIRWRAEHEKSGYEHSTPATADAIAALDEAGRHNPTTGDAPVLPHTRDPSKSISHPQATSWWNEARRLAGLKPKRGRGWHSLRRKFASDLMDQPLKVLCELGGWKTARTVLECYQQTNQARLREALAHRTRTLS